MDRVDPPRIDAVPDEIVAEAGLQTITLSAARPRLAPVPHGRENPCGGRANADRRSRREHEILNPENEPFPQHARKAGGVGGCEQRRDNADDDVGPAGEANRVGQCKRRDRQLVERLVRECSLRPGAQPGPVHAHAVRDLAAPEHALGIQDGCVAPDNWGPR